MNNNSHQRQSRFPILSNHKYAIFAFIAAIIAYHIIYSPFFMSANVGHDYSMILPQLLENYYWILKNNIVSINWFSPGLCGGQPAFADPQNIQFSFPQLLTFALPPIKAVYATVLIFAALGYWGMYGLLNKVLSLRTGMAVAGAILFMFNGFFAGRMMVGHFPFHGIMLLPLIACFLLHQPRSQQWLPEVLLAYGGGFSMAYWIHSGMISLIIPAILVLLGITGLILAERPVPIHRLIARWAGVVLLAMSLSLGKLIAGMAYLKNFPRSDYSLPAFSSPWQELIAFSRSLFLQPGNVAENYSPHLVYAQWSLDLHEWMYGVSPLPILLLLLFVWLAVHGKKTSSPAQSAPSPSMTSTLRNYFGWGLFLCMALIPLIVNWAPSQWQEFFKIIPVIKNSSNLFRWWLIDMVLLIVVSLYLAEKNSLLNRGQGWLVAIAAVLAMGWQTSTMDRAFFARQPYDSTPTTIGWEAAQRPDFTPQIKANVVHVLNGRISTPLNRNDAFMQGNSTIFCYNPIFGYRLENFPLKSLSPGPVNELIGNFFNMKNPACYVYPKENDCAPGDHFTANQKAELESFTTYKPFPFNISRAQHAANTLARIALLSLVVLVIVAFVWELSIIRRNKK